MTLAQDADPQNTPEMKAWREKIKKDLAALGVHVEMGFKMEAASIKPKVYGFPSIGHDPRLDTVKHQDMRAHLNPDGPTVAKRDYYRGKPAKKKGAKPVPGPKTPPQPKQTNPPHELGVPVPGPKTPPQPKQTNPPPELGVPLPDQETLISMVIQKEDQGNKDKKPLPKTIQDVYQDAVVSGTPADGYMKMDLSIVRFPAEWRIPRENRGIITIGAMREFKEKLEANIKMMETSSSKKMFARAIDSYKRKLAELLSLH